MTDKQSERLRQSLIDRLTELFRGVQGTVRESMADNQFFDPEEPHDGADESARLDSRDLKMRLAEGHAEQAQRIEEALSRMREGSYGECIDCGGAIELKRLELVPWTPRCVACQEAAEFDAREHSPKL